MNVKQVAALGLIVALDMALLFFFPPWWDSGTLWFGIDRPNAGPVEVGQPLGGLNVGRPIFGPDFGVMLLGFSVVAAMWGINGFKNKT